MVKNWNLLTNVECVLVRSLKAQQLIKEILNTANCLFIRVRLIDL